MALWASFSSHEYIYTRTYTSLAILIVVGLTNVIIRKKKKRKGN